MGEVIKIIPSDVGTDRRELECTLGLRERKEITLLTTPRPWPILTIQG